MLTGGRSFITISAWAGTIPSAKPNSAVKNSFRIFFSCGCNMGNCMAVTDFQYFYNRKDRAWSKNQADRE
jgi:hypothetical protein